ncbi:TetR/AcrR family transcriptional regulator [Actinomadura sp. NPDC048394]|uniref:TetR/AcrR family transcriptional regulator n=1 Tax=Actinomadura sp. NPDC048394 TaxID=3158223 RepID=UPI0033DF7FD7
MPIAKGQKQARGVARREQILDAALDAFAAEGYRATTLAKVAARVGLTEAGVLHHFSSKAALLAGVLRYRDDIDPDAVARVAGDDVVQAVRRMADLARILLEHPRLMRFDAVVGGESVAEGGVPFEHFRARLHDAREALSRHLRAAAKTGAVRSDIDADLIAGEVIAFMDGVQTQWLFDPDAIDLQRMYRHYFDQLADRLAPIASEGSPDRIAHDPAQTTQRQRTDSPDQPEALG